MIDTIKDAVKMYFAPLKSVWFWIVVALASTVLALNTEASELEECTGYANLSLMVFEFRIRGASAEYTTEYMETTYKTPPSFRNQIQRIYSIEIPEEHPLNGHAVWVIVHKECVASGGPK